MSCEDQIIAVRFQLSGSVQGIGVRPAVARLAGSCRLAGFVVNQLDGVTIHIEGPPSQIEEFTDQLESALPAPADVQHLVQTPAAVLGRREFEIRQADAGGTVATLVPRDVAACADCLCEVENPTDRRANYPFTSCTNCGPRYSLLKRMPYERRQTAMEAFPLCDVCLDEYRSAENRRFHAQTNACPACGPEIRCEIPRTKQLICGTDAIPPAAQAIRDGKILALKGIGGYQLVCDATNESAVSLLRFRKRRREKPLAVMIEPPTSPEDFPEALFRSSNPIVLIPSSLVPELALSVAPKLNRVGVMLSTTPLHALLLKACRRPLVVTSGNCEGEPLAYENGEATEQLRGIADLFLHHNREIVRPIDDSVVRPLGNRSVTIRTARGLAPLPLKCPTERSLLAVGGHQKAAIALSNGEQAVLGPHIGDLDSLTTRERFVRQTEKLRKLYGCVPEYLVHDLHPDYFTTCWAKEQPQPTLGVQHHHAHIVAGMVEHGWLDRAVLGVAFDGTGYGTDGTVWGGEFLIATATDFERIGHLRPFGLPGGEIAVRQPWRVALSLLTETLGSEKAVQRLRPLVEAEPLRQLAGLVNRGNSGPVTTSAGRLFDGVASLLLSETDASYEGQLAMQLESICDEDVSGSYSFPLRQEEKRSWLDWRPMLRQIVEERGRGTEVGEIAMRFHRSLAEGIAEFAKCHPHLPVVLSGGCFQNGILTELVREQLAEHPQPVGFPGVIPPNDGGLAAGQLAIAAARLAENDSQRGTLCV